jgi:hypothetical protein
VLPCRADPDTPIERMFEIVGAPRYGSNMCSIEHAFEPFFPGGQR